VIQGKYYDKSLETGLEDARIIEVFKEIHRWQAVTLTVLNLQVLLGLQGSNIIS
jgi:hypothetical protein